MYGWNPETWRETEKRVFKLQKRIYQASRRGDAGRVHGLQRLLINSRSGRYLAVRRVTRGQLWQENGGCGRSQIADPAGETSAGRASINR
jgi:RNA-directed DNA polymerase